MPQAVLHYRLIYVREIPSRIGADETARKMPEYIRASRVSDRFPISHNTLLRWEKRVLIVTHRPGSRMSLVKSPICRGLLRG